MAVAPGIPFDIPGYRIARQLGQGGMATVYLATQTSLGRQVAIKVLAAERTPSNELIKRFENEARTIARLDHPNIVSIYDVGRASTGQLYYTLPYLPNGDLSTRRNIQDQRVILGILRGLAQALAYAHEQGIVHRDVKPENVLFDKLDRPLLADFGIALARYSDIRMTREGATLGSTGYMSPEQARGHVIDGRSDLYSLGVIAYELLTGDLPFHGPDALSVALAHVEQAVPRLPPTRRVWQPLIDKALAKDPNDRFQDAAAFLRCLEQIEGDLDGRRKPVATAIGWRERLSAIPASFWVGASVVVGTSLLLAMLLWPGAEAPSNGTVIATGAPAVAPQPTDKPAEPPEPARAGADVAGLLATAKSNLDQGKLVTPAGDNAAEGYFAVRAADATNAEATAGLVAVLQALGRQADEAIAKGDSDSVRQLHEQARMLSERAVLRSTPDWPQYLAARRSAFEQQVAAGLQARDPAALERLQAVADTFVQDDPAFGEHWRQAQRSLAPASPPIDTTTISADAGGPELVLVPAVIDGRSLDHAFAMTRNEVTRGEYAAFAKATGRAEANCREPMKILSRFRKLSWRNPDFVQQENEPVVCVSWQDAFAYARWLSQRTGATYRLPTESEWQHATHSIGRGNICELGNVADSTMGGRFTLADRHKCNDGNAHTASVGRYRSTALGINDLVGNVAEWTLDCGAGGALDRLMKPDACPERIFRGTSWRDGPNDSTSTRRGSSDPDIGYTTVGIRLVRELDGAAGASTAGR
ncbi:bifunctional serine/threonine-protein kinase/formylglycine-generating enzyme family protein [Tahibacter amnicola]|uniref:Bifunctional serine/threonine-protein kinase/formylglycine-generating enzyme family protein n=1 Tax=Tahibacter amnicola TaxID=2976241 RepID=A0ABY6BMW4_9GAMM|nr:bifunctional serine/threonine-protein kinase/formylglycine-generating enzyme family protein [Tahibacter amnicola]UXI69911.1 bifunctional serine/threonine-protein kinase/formylglycine-generating enzyme family protein [Tahibacter amnicola]